jgi:4-hydroxy-3-polyprenylbenzoate decarboxylase
MPHDFLSDFLVKLQDADELVRVSAPVDSSLELAAIVDRVTKSRSGGPALLFENVKNGSMPIVANLLGNRRRLCLALGVDSVEQLSTKLLDSPSSDTGGWLDALKFSPSSAGLSKFAPRMIKTAVCQQVVKLGRDVNLWDLPVPRSWPGEANPVITAAQVLTLDPQTNARHVERFPLQVLGQQQLVPHWHRHHSAHRHWRAALRDQKQFPIAISLGGDPSFAVMTAAPLPPGTDELVFGGFLRCAGVDLVKGRTQPLDVPAGSEIVIEGFIDCTSPLVDAPPIASGSGFYSSSESLPTIQVTAITHRANPVLPVIAPGPPPCEESWITLAVERLFLPVIQRLAPEIVDVHQPFAGAGRNLLFVSIRKEHPQQARQVLNALWGSRQFGRHKQIVIVDADVNVRDEQTVWFALGSHTHPGRDVILNEGPTAMDDHATPVRGHGHKIGIDATRKLPEEGHHRTWPDALVMTQDVLQSLQNRWPDFGLGEQ